jgi:hypothetical protein
VDLDKDRRASSAVLSREGSPESLGTNGDGERQREELERRSALEAMEMN